jgi:diguanylate cyclase (GGDEF)-like protein
MRGDGDDASLLRARLSAIVDTTLDPLLLVRPVHDADGRVVDFVVADMNGSHTRAGGDRSTSTRMHLPERAPALLDLYRRVLRSGSTESVRRVWVDAHPQDPTSTAGWADVRATGVAGDVVVSWRNVDDDVAGEDVLRRQAMQDPLTLLPNRRALLELLSAACTSAAPFGVLFVDVDRFKSINDRHGHGVGDAVLVETGRRLAGALRSTDIVGRLAGDEFVVLARPLADRGELRSLAARLLATGEHPQRVGDHDVQVSVSVGGVWVGDGRRDVTSILHEADTLMYIAKRRGGGALLLSEAPPE